MNVDVYHRGIVDVQHGCGVGVYNGFDVGKIQVDDLTCQGHEKEHYNGAINWPGEHSPTIGHVGSALRMSIAYHTGSHVPYITMKPLPSEGAPSLTQSMRI
ncbi:hypothetical protein ElyMa_000319300 [Elysia marginata]|uniref:Uncharacterized protein n=1 Tax=Elysia marginata TaxID=1093978 RepID=A0AAV4FA34_9GAST|nr:hypothetical protein ElyMa_000319300 [Elysia marginata]